MIRKSDDDDDDESKDAYYIWYLPFLIVKRNLNDTHQLLAMLYMYNGDSVSCILVEKCIFYLHVTKILIMITDVFTLFYNNILLH